MKLLVIGLSLSSSWGNGHATTYRALLREFARRGHEVTFLERDAEWFRSNRDLPAPDFCRLEFYRDTQELQSRYSDEVRAADWVIVGSYAHDGVTVGEWATALSNRVAFYDIDTPVTLAKLARGDEEYLSPALIRRYSLYLSFSGGATLRRLEEMGAPRARALYCSVDPALYCPLPIEKVTDLNYLGTYSDDRQPTVEALLLEPARGLPDRTFEVAGPGYPPEIQWPANVARVNHLAPPEHPAFYNRTRWTLNVTRADMRAAGHSPSVRLFEAAACGAPIISDTWPGLEEFFVPDKEIVLAQTGGEVVSVLRDMDDATRQRIGEAARARVLSAHTAAHRARELEELLRGA